MKNDWIYQQFIKEMVDNQQPNFYINEEGKKVMTREFHLKRGFCCGSVCTNCPYDPAYTKNITTVK